MQDVSDPSPHQRNVAGNSIESVSVTAASVRGVFLDLDVDSSMGPDGIHPCLLKSCPSLVEPMFLIFSRSLDDGVLPAQWKFSEIVPIFKKGSRRDPLNYRPISLTSVCCKSLERLIASALMDYLESNLLMSPDQFGFRKGRAVEDQLLLVYEDVTMWLDSGCCVDMVLFDFSKAFDVVSHEVLLDKLSLLGISGRLLGWIGDFLVGRQMCVSVSGARSLPRPVLSGVPQGSVLGPLLFLVFVNHLPSYLLNKSKMFADDLKIYVRLERGSGDGDLCQQDIDVLHRVAVSWGLNFNVNKCTIMRFRRGHRGLPDDAPITTYTMNGSNLTLGVDARDLGVLVDSSLRFHVHASHVVDKSVGSG